jgi:hypothetical protein
VIASGMLEAVGTRYSLNDPAVVIQPILLALFSVNQSLPFGAAVTPVGLDRKVGTTNSVMARVWQNATTQANEQDARQILAVL